MIENLIVAIDLTAAAITAVAATATAKARIKARHSAEDARQTAVDIVHRTQDR